MSENYENKYWNNRTACTVLEDLRGILKALRDNNSCTQVLTMLVCVEELQYAFNRMEAAIGDLKQMKKMREERTKLKAEIRELRKKKKKLNSGTAVETNPHLGRPFSG